MGTSATLYESFQQETGIMTGEKPMKWEHKFITSKQGYVRNHVMEDASLKFVNLFERFQVHNPH